MNGAQQKKLDRRSARPHRQGNAMSAPDELESAVWQAIGRYSVEICRPDAELAPPQYLLNAVKALAKRAATAPQGAEIAREAPRSAHPDVVRLLREFHLDAMGRGHDPNHALTKLMVSGYMQKRGPEVIAALAAHDRMMAEVSAAIDAALTPTDAETKND